MPANHERPRKRQRVTQACHRCRSKKFRCDAQGPPCGACETAQAACSYDDANVVRRRGLKPGYVKVLESLWGSALQSIPGSEDTATRLLARLASSTDQDSNNHESSPLEIWRKSTLPATIDSILDGGHLSCSEDPSLQRDDDASLPTTEHTWSLSQPLLINPGSIGPVDSHGTSVQSSSAGHPVTSSRPGCANSSLPDLPADWQHLVQVYLCTEHCCLPLFEKSSIYRWAYSYQESGSFKIVDLDCDCRGHFASLWAVFALAEMHSKGITSTRISELEQTGRSLILTAETIGPGWTYSLAYLLWALLHTGRHALVLARMMLAQAIILADPRINTISSADNEQYLLMRNGCFVVDAILAFATGSEEVSPGQTAVSFDTGNVGEWDPFVNILDQGETTQDSSAATQAPASRTGSTYLHMIRLVAILRNSLRRGTDLNSAARELEDWKARLPINLLQVITQRATPQKVVPSQLNLRLWYCAVSCTIEDLQRRTTSSTDPSGDQDRPEMSIVDIIDSMVRCHSLRILPATTSVVMNRKSVDSLLHSNTSAVQGMRRIHREFSRHWGYKLAPFNTDSSPLTANPDAAREFMNGSQATLHPTSSDTVTSVFLNDSILATGHEGAPATALTQDMSDTTWVSQQQLIGLPRTASPQALTFVPVTTTQQAVDSSTASALENPHSHDLLDYLNIFEGDNRCVFSIFDISKRSVIWVTNVTKRDDRDYMEPLGFIPHQ